MTLEELIAKAKQDPTFQKAVVMWAKDTTEGKEILNNFATAHFEEKVKTTISDLHKGYDEDIFAILGERKDGEQKSYDYVKKLVGELKGLRGQGDGEKDKKISELNEQIKKLNEGGEINDHWKGIYTEALKKWETTENELKEKLTNNETTFNESKIDSDLSSALAGLNFTKGLPQEAIDAMVSTLKTEAMKNAKLVDGKVKYFDKDGKPMMNEEYKEATASDFWKTNLKTIIDNSAGGGGGGGASTNLTDAGKIIKVGEGDSAKDKLVLDSEKFSTKSEFNAHAEKTLKGMGISTGDKEFNTLLDGAYEEYGVKDLEFE